MADMNDKAIIIGIECTKLKVRLKWSNCRPGQTNICVHGMTGLPSAMRCLAITPMLIYRRTG